MKHKPRIQLDEQLKSLYIDTAKKLKGSDRRQFMAKLVQGWGFGGARFAEQQLGWNRRTIRKGMLELTHGISIADSFRLRGRKSVENKFPNLLSDIVSIVEPHSQTDPSFKTTNLYTRISAAKVRALLIENKGLLNRP